MISKLISPYALIICAVVGFGVVSYVAYLNITNSALRAENGRLEANVKSLELVIAGHKARAANIQEDKESDDEVDNIPDDGLRNVPDHWLRQDTRN